MKKVTKKELEEVVMADSVGYSKKEGRFIFKMGFFYKHGESASSFAEKCTKQLNEAGFVALNTSAVERWNAWPKDSWFEFRAEVSRRER